MSIIGKRLTLIAMCMALSMAALDDTVVTVALPNLQLSLGMSVTGLQWVLTAYLLPIACLVLPAGTLGDLYGRRRVFLIGLIGFVGGSILAGLAVSGAMVVAGRLVQGIGAAALLPTSLAILSDAFPNPKERTKAIGIWSGVSGLALIVGPAIGGILVDTLGWRSIFFLNLPLGMLTFWLTCRAVSAGHRHSMSKKHSKPLDWQGMILSTVMLASFVILLTGGGDGAAENHALLFGLGLGLLSLGSAVAFVVVEIYSACPMLPLGMLRQAAFTTAIATNALLFFMLVSLLFLLSLFLQQVQGYSAAATGLRFLPLNGAFILASILSGYASAKLGWRTAITSGFLIAGLGVLSLAQIQPNTPYGDMLWQLMLVGFGIGFTLSPLTAVGMDSAPTAHSGIAAALLNTSTRLGGALGIAVQGSVLAQGLGHHLARSLAAWGLSSTAQQAIVAEALGHGATRPDRLAGYLPPTISIETLEQTIHRAFVSGMHSVMWVAAIALLLGAAASFTWIKTERVSKTHPYASSSIGPP